MGEKHFVFYNPPVVNKQLGIRKGALNETRALAQTLLHNDIPTIVFAKSRIQVEVLTRALKTSGKNGDARYAATGAVICPASGSASSGSFARGRSSWWSPPTRWSWVWTSAR